MITGAELHDGIARGAFDSAVGDELRGERATLGKTLLDVQRDLRIKAAYIAAIEDAEPGVFPNASFVPGYVRSYARYLGRDPEEIYARFCAESGFAGPAAAARPAAGGGRARAAVAAAATGPGTFRPNFPMAAPARSGLPMPPLPAIGSLVVLLGLAVGLGYGGWTVLHNIQRVQFAPVEELPAALAAVAPAPEPEAAGRAGPDLRALASPVAAAALADLYRSRESEVRILVPRDGPIAALDPDFVGLLAAAVEARTEPAGAADGPAAAGPALETAVLQDGLPEPEPLAAAEPPTLVVVAERAAWIRVYLADKTVLFEQILETGETYSPPADVEGPLIWAGNSGSVYVRLGDTLRGPLGSGTRAVRDVVLAPEAIAERYGVVEQAPEAISRAFDPTVEAALEAAAVALQ